MAQVWELEERKRVYYYPSGQADYNSEYILQYDIRVKFLWWKFRQWVDIYSIDGNEYYEDPIKSLLESYNQERKYIHDKRRKTN